MVRIRLRRQGRQEATVLSHRCRRSAAAHGRILENIGFYNPRVDPIEYNIDIEARPLLAQHWVRNPANRSLDC